MTNGPAEMSREEQDEAQAADQAELDYLQMIDMAAKYVVANGAEDFLIDLGERIKQVRAWKRQERQQMALMAGGDAF